MGHSAARHVVGALSRLSISPRTARVNLVLARAPDLDLLGPALMHWLPKFEWAAAHVKAR